MSLSSTIARASQARLDQIKRAFDITKLEREAMAAAYAKSGAQLAGNINLQQYDWKLDRMAGELREQGISVDWPVAAPASSTLRLRK